MSPVRPRGRPPGRTKVSTTLRLDRAVLDAFKATGKGWQTRINNALRDWLKKGLPNWQTLAHQECYGRGPGDPADCPAKHGPSCCGYPELCRKALQKKFSRERTK